MLVDNRNYEIELERRDSAKPVGDFVAQVASAVVVMLCFLPYYNSPVIYRGYETPQGIIILAIASLCCIFSSTVLAEKYFRRDFWMSRSPGWFYGLTAFVVVLVSLAAMLFPFKQDPNYGAMAGTFFSGLFLMFAGLLKF